MTDLAEETEIEARLRQAATVISNACAWSAATAFIPLPVIDLAALAAVQANMINDLAKLYGETFAKDAVRGVVSVLLGTLIPGSLASGLKAAPGIGTIVGTITFGAFSAASSYAVGKVIVRHFENGGTAMSFDARSVGDELQKEFSGAHKKAT